MKIKYLSMFFAAVALMGACSDSKDQPDDPDNEGNEGGSTVVAADIDYTADNAASWANYMTQVSNLLVKDSEELYDAWTVSYNGGKSFAEIFKNHSGGEYSSALGCLEQIIDGCSDIANEVGSSKIGEPYNLWQEGNHEKALYAVESWYSWHSREDYSNNIISIRNSYYGSLDGSVARNSMATLIAESNPALDNQMRAAIQEAYDAILAIPSPFRNNINSKESVAAMDACADLEELLTQKLKSALQQIEDEAKMQAVLDNYVDNIVLPTYKNLKDRNAGLRDAVAAFKQNPDDNTFADCAEAWLNAREPWETSEAFLFGPVDALGLDPNMDSWPLDQDAIVQILNSGNYDDLNWSDTDSDDKIEAVQSVRGFHTLEFLIFKDGKARKMP